MTSISKKKIDRQRRRRRSRRKKKKTEMGGVVRERERSGAPVQGRSR